VIRLTNPDGAEFYLNADYIEMVDGFQQLRRSADGAEVLVTTITLRDGRHHLVREAAAEIAQRFVDFQRAAHGCLRELPLAAAEDEPAATDQPGGED
jgi:uncharacterized protein YlzI (FlbEa/FlbD family)